MTYDVYLFLEKPKPSSGLLPDTFYLAVSESSGSGGLFGNTEADLSNLRGADYKRIWRAIRPAKPDEPTDPVIKPNIINDVPLRLRGPDRKPLDEARFIKLKEVLEALGSVRS